jgi:hypothetical protein
MIVFSFRPTVAEVSAALAAGLAVELRQSGVCRLIGQDPAVEIDALGDRLWSALEYQMSRSEWPHTDTDRDATDHPDTDRADTSCQEEQSA